jgi:hypothetical protein
MTATYIPQPTHRSARHRVSTDTAAETSADIPQTGVTAPEGESGEATNVLEDETTAQEWEAQEGRGADEVESRGEDAEAGGEASADGRKLPEGEGRSGEVGSSYAAPSIDEVVENVSILAQELRRVAADAR